MLISKSPENSSKKIRWFQMVLQPGGQLLQTLQAIVLQNKPFYIMNKI